MKKIVNLLSFLIISTFAFSQELELVESIKDSDTGIDGLIKIV